MDDIFRKFFGMRRYGPHEYPRGNENDQDDDIFIDRGTFFGPRRGGGLDDMFDHFHRDMFNQMESLHRQMEDMMKGFGATDFPSDFSPPSTTPIDPGKADPGNRIFVWSSPSPFFRHGSDHSKKSPREFMLKEEEKEDSKPKTILPGKAKDEEKPLFNLPRWKNSRPEKMEDTDLDGKLSDENVLELIKRPEAKDRADHNMYSPPRTRPGGWFSNQSISISTFSGSDGKVEQKRVVRDSSGREESSVTRSIGDKSYTVTTITDDSGAQEKHEKLHNMDEGDLNKFEDLWSKGRQERPKSPGDSMLNQRPLPSAPVDPHDQGIFFKLFGRGGN